MARFAHIGLSLVFATLWLTLAEAQSVATSAVSPEVAKLLHRIKSVDSDLLAVSEEDGHFFA